MTDAELVATLEKTIADLKARVDAAEKKALSDDLRARLVALLAS